MRDESFSLYAANGLKAHGMVLMEGDVNSLSAQETQATSASTFTI